MSVQVRMWIEIIFNTFYLVMVWGLVIAMLIKWQAVKQDEKKPAFWIVLAFAFLGLGDIPHVGFRALAFACNDPEMQVTLMGKRMYVVPLGAVATAWTFTLFYVCMVFLWKRQFKGSFGLLSWIIFGLAIFRSLFMLHPGNAWGSLQNPEPWNAIRNIALMLMQISIAFLLLRDSIRFNEKAVRWIAIMILISFSCYAPAILLYQKFPLIGLLMIPKTIAYLVIAFIGYKRYFSAQPVAAAA